MPPVIIGRVFQHLTERRDIAEIIDFRECAQIIYPLPEGAEEQTVPVG